MEPVSSLREIAACYRYMLVDVYGVLHDGGEPFAPAVQALAQARQCGIGVVILTNSPGRVEAVKARLARLGVDCGQYDHVVTSGELSWQHLAAVNRAAPRLPRVRAIRETRWPGWIDEIANPKAVHAGEADYLIVAGMPWPREEDFLASDFEQELHAALSRDLAMVVANSDETYPSRGVVRLGPGWLGRRYSEADGRTIEFGKPRAPIYNEALRLIGSPDPLSVLMIGDNLRTDIAGATAQGFDSLLVLSRGVHLGQSREAVLAEAVTLGAEPTWTMGDLRW